MKFKTLPRTSTVIRMHWRELNEYQKKSQGKKTKNHAQLTFRASCRPSSTAFSRGSFAS